MLPPFGWEPALTRWQFAPVVTTVVVLSTALYLWGAVRVGRRHPARPWPRSRTGLFLAGLAVVVLATESGIGSYDDILFWDHMVQHLMLIMIAPPLLIGGQPAILLLHASRNPLHTWAKRLVRSRVVTFLTWPVCGFLAYTGAIVAAHLTSLANLVESSEFAHNAEHAAFLIIGYLFFLPLLGREPIRWRLSYPIRFVTLVLVMPVDTFTGLVLGYGNTGTPGVPDPAEQPAWAPGVVQDLHWGGAIMWIGGDALMFGLMMLVFAMWSQDDRVAGSGRGWLEAARRTSMASLVASHAAPGPDEAADQVPAATASAAPTQDPDWSSRRSIDDDDEHLAAYNAFLARLNKPGQRPRG
jgi:cytochrome c oxidase assembly factor CtaG